MSICISLEEDEAGGVSCCTMLAIDFLSWASAEKFFFASSVEEYTRILDPFATTVRGEGLSSSFTTVVTSRDGVVAAPFSATTAGANVAHAGLRVSTTIGAGAEQPCFAAGPEAFTTNVYLSA
jgi:hypothetical protein